MNNDFFSEKVSEAFRNALANQPEIARRKNTINGVTGTLLHVAGISAASLTGVPWWAALLFSLIVGAVQVVHSATSEGPLTPSQERKLLAEVKKVETPEIQEANTLNTLMNIFDAVNNQRARERGIDGYGLGAQNEAIVEPQEDEVDYTPRNALHAPSVPAGTPLDTFQSLARD